MIKLLWKGVKWLGQAVLEAVKWIYRLIKSGINLVLKYISLTLLTLGVSFLIVISLWKIWDHNLTKLMQDVPGTAPSKTIQEIFGNIARVTEVTNRVPPVGMYAGLESYVTVNAFTNGYAIYFTMLADKVLNEDEKALIMGHEIAHVILHHTDNEYQTFLTHWSNEDELMADNVGAHWAHKAGYDVCKGREVFMKFYQWGGNSLNATHPPNTIRYQNLEHYCNQGENDGQPRN
jgi:Zn-dependent protease with chaperone function